MYNLKYIDCDFVSFFEILSCVTTIFIEISSIDKLSIYEMADRWCSYSISDAL